jgi:hypothetical protein
VSTGRCRGRSAPLRGGRWPIKFRKFLQGSGFYGDGTPRSDGQKSLLVERGDKCLALGRAIIDLTLPGKRLSDAFVWLNGDSSPSPPIEDDHAPAVIEGRWH